MREGLVSCSKPLDEVGALLTEDLCLSNVAHFGRDNASQLRPNLLDTRPPPSNNNLLLFIFRFMIVLRQTKSLYASRPKQSTTHPDNSLAACLPHKRRVTNGREEPSVPLVLPSHLNGEGRGEAFIRPPSIRDEGLALRDA